MKYFVCSDIHGYFDEWLTALESKGFDVQNENHKVIVCGDLFDRGRQPQKIIDFILSHSEKFILIRGNHEDLMQDMIDRNENSYADLLNGTAETIVDLCPQWLISEFDLKRIARRTKLQDILDMCVNFYETKHYIFVHSWIPTLDDEYVFDVNWRMSKLARWETARWRNPLEMTAHKLFEPKKKIVFGHWHCSAFWQRLNPEKYSEFGENANDEPFETENYIAIDACTAVTKKVNVLVIED